MTPADLNPFIRYAKIHKTYLNRPENSVCYDCRMFLLESGHGRLTLNGEEIGLTPGTAIFLPPATRYHFFFQPDPDHSFIVLDFDLTQSHCHLEESLYTATESSFDPARVPTTDAPPELMQPIIRQAPQLSSSLRQCRDLFLEKELFYRENASALLKMCLLELIRGNVLRHGNAQLCDQIIHYIHKKCAEGEVNNRMIAEHFGYHPHYLSNIIRTYTGKSLHQYMISYRLRLAKNLLLTTTVDVEEIAWRTGFCSSSHFIKVFRTANGITPHAYRKSRIRTDL